jgi:urease beta subunit
VRDFPSYRVRSRQAVLVGDGDVRLSARPARADRGDNTGDRPIRVSGHCHFIETNRALAFDRSSSPACVHIPAGCRDAASARRTKTVRS